MPDLAMVPEMVDNLFPVHTDTVIGDGQGAVVFIKRNPHAQLAVSLIQIRLRQRAETQLIGRIRGVGNQLTQKDFFVGIGGNGSSGAEVVLLLTENHEFLVLSSDSTSTMPF
ncbi:Uncharacterised protein [Klebsiella pneumoniae]|uniref:Uncharacterized protein n=1 Tax=Klebsiella pneumoniae TaxID=573 RepID=A0A2X3C4A2_KLEPN|nr:Uncharacterised protein [Klebsiella pneumoniae]